MATASVLSIGTEITRGELVNTNASYLAEGLTARGFEVTEICTVDDDAPRIEACLARLGGSCDVIVSTGGLGPTTDDITTECVARLLGVPLRRDPESFAILEQPLRDFGRSVSASNAKQTDFPVGASVLPNPNGSAPGFCVRIARALAFFMPGVPREMKPMFESSVLPAVAPLVDVASHQIHLQTFGLPESEANDRLAGVEAQFGVLIGYRVSMPVLEIKVLARDASASVAETRARTAADEVRRRLGDVVYAEGHATLPEVLGAELKSRGLRLACAESCTGGLVGELLTDRPSASEFFAGSAVVYENRQKTRLLGVDAALIEQHGAVSEPVARAMAEGALRVFEVDVALAITGIAGPGGGTETKPVGLVHYAVATPRGTTARSFVFVRDRYMVRRRAAFAALDLAHRVIRQGHP
ncbi:MAG TPA: CinA family nicotinamide mononucleotide deamidase-related protein [Polyangiaceae bacterium]|nr:CinA family nicotinamide mononucleotide deamidase-related protein [Polyangiaceae bacterium]